MALAYSTTVRNGMLDQITSNAGASAKILFYTASRPATGGAVTTLLATLTCNATFAPASSGGVLTLNAITTANASASGTATWFRLTTSGGTFIMDGDVGAGSGDLSMSTNVFVSGSPVAVSSFVITEGNP